MPGGLRDVEQRFTAETSGYDAGLRRMIEANKELIESVRQVVQRTEEIKRSVGDDSGWRRMATSLDETSTAIRRYNAMLDEARAVNEQFNASQVQTEKLAGEGRQALRDLSAEYRRHSETVGEARKAQAIFRDGLIDQANSSTGAVVAMDAHEQAVARLAKTYGTAREAFAKSDFSAPIKATTEDVKVLAETLKTTYADAQGVTRMVPHLQVARMGVEASAAAELAAMKAAMGGGGGGGGAGGALAAGAAAGGGRGGGGGAAPSFVPWAGGGWQAVRFWGMMAAEVSATVIPALAAAGSAALVGVQGIEQILPRYKAIYTTSEALGGALGMTTGKFLGGGTALQSAQDIATGGAYDIAGSVLGIIRAGGGQGFLRQGTDTVSMLDRGFAAMSLNFQQGGLGKKISDALGGGTGYLRQFGDVGANIGNTLLNVAPNLPGVGEDLLGALTGGTGLLATASRDIPGPLMKGFLTYEAASRWLPALAGGQGLIGRMLGLRGVGGLGGLLGKGGEALFARGMGGALGDVGLGMMGAGDALAALGGFPAALALAGGTMEWGALDRASVTPWGTTIGNLQKSVAGAGFTGAWEPLGKAVTTAAGLRATAPAYAAPTREQLVSRAGPGLQAAYALSQGPQAQQALGGFAQQMGDLINAGPQLVAALKKAGLKGVSLADAFQIGQNAMLDMSHAFGKDGKLKQVAQEMVTSYARVIGPMTQSPGAFGAAVGAQTIMSQGAMQNLAKVNQAMDSYQQIIAGGPLGASGLAAGAGAAPAGAIAKGLTGYTSPASAQAWQAFASTSSSAPGFITQMQQFGDQMRTYLTLGTANMGQTKGFSAFELQRILPQAKQSPAALAMLMQQGASMGVTGYYDTSKSQAQNYKDVASALHSAAFSSSQFKKNMDSVTIATANIPAVAKQFAQDTSASIHSQQVAKAAQDAMNIKGGINIKANTADLVGQLRAAGVQGGAALKASLDAVLSQAGVGKAQRLKIEGQYFPPHIPKPPNQRFTINGHVNMPPIPRVPDQSFTITGHVVMVGGQVSPYTPAGARANLGPAAYFHPAAAVNPSAYTHLQTGGMVPGSGHGDIIPAMLEPGEAIIPRYLVPLIAPFLAAHRVPGFGGMPQSSSSHFAGGGIVPHIPGFPDAVNLQGKAGQFAWTLIDGITKALKDSGAKNIAQALVSKIGQEIQYAKGISSSVKSGLNLAGMDLTQGGVLGQMQNYAASAQAFGGDLTKLRKGHLNKDLISQIIGAGPVQGDMLAQSILGGPGGIGAVNALYKQIGHSANIIGAQGAMAQYGGTLAPNLKSGTFTSNNVSINISAGAGATLALSDAQIKQLVAKIQAALLKQAKRNPKTGLQLGGKGA